MGRYYTGNNKNLLSFVSLILLTAHCNFSHFFYTVNTLLPSMVHCTVASMYASILTKFGIYDIHKMSDHITGLSNV
jgi:hypothetical protein